MDVVCTQANQLTDTQLVAQPGGLAFGFATHSLLVPPGSPHPSAKGHTNRLSPRNSESSRYVPLAHWPACGYKSSSSINVANRADSAFPPRLTPRRRRTAGTCSPMPIPVETATFQSTLKQSRRASRAQHRCGLLLQTSHVPWSVSLCVEHTDEPGKSG